MGGVSVLPFSPSLLTALHSVVFLFQKFKPFFLSFFFIRDEQWMIT